MQGFLKLSQLHEPGKFSSWLRQIALNVHRMRRRSPAPIAMPLDEEIEMKPRHESSEIETVVQEALAKLREPERLALTLHYINGYTQSEIGSFLGVQPATVKTRLARARQHLRKEIMAMVEDTFESKKLPEGFTKETVEAAMSRASVHLKEGRIGEARHEYDDIVRRAGVGPVVNEYQAVLKRIEEHVPALVGLGLAYQAAGKDEEAVIQLRRAVEKDPKNALAWGAICQILGGHGDKMNELAGVYEERLRVQPEAAPHLHAALGDIYMALGKQEEAERHLRLALEADPTQLMPSHVLGSLLLNQGLYDEALAVLSKAAAINPQDKWTRLEMANVHTEAGRFGEAIELARRALLIGGERYDRMTERCLRILELCHHETGRLESFPALCRSLRDEMSSRHFADRVQWYLALFLESRLQRPEAMAEFTRLGAIPARCWRVVVPFDNTNGCGMGMAYPPEHGITLEASYVGQSGRHLRWRRPVWEGAGFELNFAIMSHRWGVTADAVGYGFLRIVSTKPREALFRFGASGWTQVWLNGESIFLDRTFVGVPDNEKTPLKLKRGKNDLFGQDRYSGAVSYATRLPLPLEPLLPHHRQRRRADKGFEVSVGSARIKYSGRTVEQLSSLKCRCRAGSPRPKGDWSITESYSLFSHF